MEEEEEKKGGGGRNKTQGKSRHAVPMATDPPKSLLATAISARSNMGG